MKKLFGGINLTWKMIIISAIIIGITVGLLNSVPALYDTTITDIATVFDFWILCGIFIIMNSKSNKDSALKCFVFFLISQPLIYLCEVPFKSMGWGLFVYYKPWFIWTLLCLPMGYIGYYMKKNKWYSLIILIPMLVLLGMGFASTITNVKYSFPKHIINTIFTTASLIIYPLVLFDKKALKYTGLLISIVIMAIFGFKPIFSPSTYDTQFKCSSETLIYDDTYKVYLEDSKYGDLSIKYEQSIESYCIQASFKKPGKTKVILESPSGEKQIFNITIGKQTYSFDDEEEIVITDSDELYGIAAEYIVNNDENPEKTKDRYKMFIEYERFGITQDDKYRYVYMWILEESYYIENNKIISGSGSSMPYKFTFELNKNEIVKVETPKDGNEYVSSIKEMYPDNLEDKAINYTSNDKKLIKEVKEYYSDLKNKNIYYYTGEEYIKLDK